MKKGLLGNNKFRYVRYPSSLIFPKELSDPFDKYEAYPAPPEGWKRKARSGARTCSVQPGHAFGVDRPKTESG